MIEKTDEPLSKNQSASVITKEQSATLRKIFTERFSGIILIDKKTQILKEFHKDFTGEFNKIVVFNDVPYDVQFASVAEKNDSFINTPYFKRSIAFKSVVENLDSVGYYATFFSLVTQKGSYRFFRIAYEYLNDDNDTIVMMAEDVSDILVGEIDLTTGAYNMVGFKRHVSQWIAKNPGRKFRLHRYDVDNFRDVNGVYGRPIGDKLLRDIANYMKTYDSDDSFSAHLSADHFIRFCADDVISVEECYQNFINYFKTYHLSIPITMHMGVYDLAEAEGEQDVGVISYKALLALKSIKNDMNTRIAYYKPEMLETEQEALELLNSVEQAIENENFEVWFQPQIDYENKSIFSAEALIRWRHPEKGLLAPIKFIPLLEKSNLISMVDLYMINKVCTYVNEWKAKNPKYNTKVSINLSRADILKNGFVEKLLEIVKNHGVSTDLIHFEVTESAYSDNVSVIINRVNQLRNYGFKVELDDFGAGYSSLNTLKDIDVDTLKLDMEFLAGNKTDGKDKTIISAIISMAKQLGLPVVAEGIETKEQADMLYSFGCNNMQGYYFSKPLTVSDYEDLLFGRKTLPALK